MASVRLFVRLGCMGVLCSSLFGCAVVRVDTQNAARSLIEQRDSTLTRDRLSEATISVLSITGQDQTQCLQQLEACLAQLQQVPEMPQEQYLSAASELYLSQAFRLKCEKIANASTPKACLIEQQNALLNSIRHAYAYLFFSNRPPEQRLFDNRQVQVRDFYHMAVAQWVKNGFAQLRAAADQPNGVAQALPLGQKIRYPLGEQQLSVSNFHPMLSHLPEQLVPADDLSFRGLRAINRRDGFGVEFVAVLPQQGAIDSAAPRVHHSRYLPVSMVLRIDGKDLKNVLSSQQFSLDIYDPYQAAQVPTAPARKDALAANYSAPYGLWLARTDLAMAAYRNLLALESDNAQPQLYMLEPYNPNKRVIILIHGLASSPEAWISLTNDVIGDPILRQGYQVWQVFYPTNMPILESRYQILRLIEAAYQQVNPKRTDKAAQHAVVIGHSMGAVIARLLLSNDDISPAALQKLNRRDRNRLLKIATVRDRFRLQALPMVDRAIFVSAPFRGTDFADRWFTLAARRIIQLPSSFVRGIAEQINQNLADSAFMQRLEQTGVLGFENGASELSAQSRFMALTAAVALKPNLTFHSIMGQQNPAQSIVDSSDGVVPYRSSHLAGAASEKVIIGDHSIQEKPEAVLEIRRILRLHLQQLGEAEKPTAPLPIPP